MYFLRHLRVCHLFNELLFLPPQFHPLHCLLPSYSDLSPPCIHFYSVLASTDYSFPFPFFSTLYFIIFLTFRFSAPSPPNLTSRSFSFSPLARLLYSFIKFLIFSPFPLISFPLPCSLHLLLSTPGFFFSQLLLLSPSFLVVSNLSDYHPVTPFVSLSLFHYLCFITFVSLPLFHYICFITILYYSTGLSSTPSIFSTFFSIAPFIF